jgi:hypothetical protein
MRVARKLAVVAAAVALMLTMTSSPARANVCGSHAGWAGISYQPCLDGPYPQGNGTYWTYVYFGLYNTTSGDSLVQWEVQYKHNTKGWQPFDKWSEYVPARSGATVWTLGHISQYCQLSTQAQLRIAPGSSSWSPWVTVTMAAPYCSG